MCVWRVLSTQSPTESRVISLAEITVENPSRVLHRDTNIIKLGCTSTSYAHKEAEFIRHAI